MPPKELAFITVECKSYLSCAIKKEYNKLITLLSNMPLSLRKVRMIEGTGGKVSCHDLIAYQVGWGNLLIGWYEAGLLSKTPEIPGEGFFKWDYIGLAKHFYRRYSEVDEKSLQDMFFHVVCKIIDIIEYEDTNQNLDKIGVWDWCTLASGKKWPLSKWIRVNTLAAYKRAIRLIKQSLMSTDLENNIECKK